MDASGAPGRWYCYMLISADGGPTRTYVGATVDPDRRLRQHNGEIRGGARATSGRAWRRQFLVGTFESERAALRFEWYWKYLTRSAPGASVVERRLHALSGLLAEDWGSVVEILEGAE